MYNGKFGKTEKGARIRYPSCYLYISVEIIGEQSTTTALITLFNIVYYMFNHKLHFELENNDIFKIYFFSLIEEECENFFKIQ